MPWSGPDAPSVSDSSSDWLPHASTLPPPDVTTGSGDKMAPHAGGCAPSDREELEEVLELVVREARAYLASVDERPVRSPNVAAASRSFRRPLPEHGSGAAAALRELLERGLDATITSSGPRCFHLVIGGNT